MANPGDVAEIARALAVLHSPGQVVELRALNASTADWRNPHTVSGYFDQPDALAREAARLTQTATGVYVTLNPVQPTLLARAANRVRNVGKSDPLTSDADITRLTRLPIDTDPDRPAGISANDTEHAAALDRSQQMRDWLTGHGWPAPIRADSGNGGHLLYAIDLPNDADSTALLRNALEALDFLFTGDGVKVDTTVHNPARIWKLYGTWARKGDSTSDRPHRLARLLDVPEAIGTVSAAQLQALAGLRPIAPPASDSRNGATGQAFDLTRWVSDRRLDVFDPVPYQGTAKKWIFRACPFNPAHTDRSAVLIQWASGAAYFRCQHNGCTGKTWRDLRALYESDRTTPRAVLDTQPSPPPVADAATPAPAGAPSPTFNTTDQGNGERLVARHGQDLRYCRLWGKWLVWDGQRWAVDDTAEVERRAKTTIRAIYSEAAAVVGDDEASKAQRRALAGWAGRSESRGKLEAMIKQAASEPGVAVAPDDLDADPWLLNVQNGTLDLRTGQLRPHNRADLITKLCPVEYNPDASAPTWAAFLARIMADNADLVTFLQRAIGYSLTGSSQERVFFVCHGKGANGKTTLLETVQALLGDYATRTPTETLMVKRAGEASNDVARLKGARFVFASEAEEGQRLAVSRVKDMTGGDTLAARFMYSEYFEFRAEFKIWLATNHRPGIKDTNTAIWDRLREIPFTVRIEPKDQDRKMPQKLLAELPGILAWAVRGCLDWQRDGLGAPQDVQNATENYRSEMDDLAGWLAECCAVGDNKSTTAAAAFTSYVDFTGDKRMTKREFGTRLKERGFKPDRSNKARVWLGFELLDYSGLPLLKSDASDASDTENDNLPTSTAHEGELAPVMSLASLASPDTPQCSECENAAVRQTSRGWLCAECIEFHARLGVEDL